MLNPLSNFAVNFNLRRYTEVEAAGRGTLRPGFGEHNMLSIEALELPAAVAQPMIAKFYGPQVGTRTSKQRSMLAALSAS